MPQTIERVDISSFVAANPESDALARAHLDSKPGWWQNLCDEYESGLLTPVEAVAAYAAGMTDSFVAVKYANESIRVASQLTVGQVVTMPKSEYRGYSTYDRRFSGRITEPVQVLLGHQNARRLDQPDRRYAGIGLGIQLDTRADVWDASPWQFGAMDIGRLKIRRTYTDMLREFDDFEARYTVFRDEDELRDRIQNAAIIKQLGIYSRSSTFNRECKTLLDASDAVFENSQSDRHRTSYERRQAVRIISPLATLDDNRAEEQIQYYAKKLYKEEDLQVLAAEIAAVRSPKILESYPDKIQKAATLEAQAEILRIQAAD